jgi:regulator of sigma E protease
MNLIETVLAFLFALGPLIIFHELGHYLVARLCGVKVLRFSLGMGKVVWSRRFGRDQTEWVISALPIGGYVKMLDSRDPDGPAIDAAELKREFTRQSVWRRIAIVGAGPLANFILAIVLFTGLNMVGVAEPSTRVRAAPEASVAHRAGLRAGDLVIAVDGTPVAAWSELRWEVLQAALEHRAARLEVRQAGGGQVSVTIDAAALAALDVDGDLLGGLGMGVALPDPVIEKVIEGGAGARAGLLPGDLIVGVDGHAIADARVFIDAVRPAGGRTLAIEVRRAGAPLTLAVTPELDPAGKVGVIKILVAQRPELVTVRASPGVALAKAARKTWDMSVMSIKMIGKMITGEVSLKNLTGPITIADYAGQSARMGPSVYLGFIAFISISLGVMNLLPIPVLDGGLLLYYSLEVLTGRPLPERISEFAQRAGMGLLLVLMALAVFNDVVRLL